MAALCRDAARSLRALRAFTLIELLVVIAIVGLLAGLAMPVLHNFRPNYTASVTQQLLTDLARARQLAISQRTTVYMVFVPTNFWRDPAYGVNWTRADFVQATNLLDKQLIGYNFVSLRSIGDQPGRPSVHYLSSWKTLPEGGFIYPTKFVPSTLPVMNVFTNLPGVGSSLAFRIFSFDFANTVSPGSPVIPFPLETTARAGVRNPYITLPYIAFDYMGRLASSQGQGQGAILPISRGTIVFARDQNKVPRIGPPSINETPVGNVTNGYNLVYVDNITGRARALQQEVR
jgi:prepilin-type N-terminal cleavage/methylation domain-containing protein